MKYQLITLAAELAKQSGHRLAVLVEGGVRTLKATNRPQNFSVERDFV